MISTILVPHDGTEMSDKAFGKAVELAKALGSSLILLHVLEEISVPFPMLILGNDKVLMNRAKRDIRRQLEKGWDKFMEIKTHEIEDQNLSLSGELRYGSAPDKILRLSKDKRIDIIVMGSRRLKGVSKLKALGSVTRKVSEQADCPVLIVH